MKISDLQIIIAAIGFSVKYSVPFDKIRFKFNKLHQI